MKNIEVLEIEESDLIRIGREDHPRAALTTEALRAMHEAPIVMLTGQIVKNRYGSTTASLDSVLNTWYDVRR